MRFTSSLLSVVLSAVLVVGSAASAGAGAAPPTSPATEPLAAPSDHGLATGTAGWYDELTGEPDLLEDLEAILRRALNDQPQSPA